jgi:DNA segregation ATPase FtsK/SpoIIIE-like protein
MKTRARDILKPVGLLAFGSVAMCVALQALPLQAIAQVTSTTANAEIDPPGRVARIGYFDNSVSFLAAGSQEWESAMLNRPIIAGDQLSTDAGARAEMHVGSTALRLGSQTHASFSRLDDNEAFITVQQGTLSLRVRQLFPGEHLEVNTPNVALSITQPGEYRVDVNAAGGTTRVTVPSGGGVLYGEGGQTVTIGSPQQLTFAGRALAQVSAQNAAPRDAFDQWTMARDRQEDQSISARYVSREVVGYQQLDAYGDWSTDATHGNIWYPRVTVANWAPYRYGQWRYVQPWGWTWVDDAPWGFAPSHYGRWTQVGPRWGWVPGPIAPRPVYAPALVAFIGGSSGGVNWNVSIGGGSPGVGWFPLAPGEAYRPAYRASPRYVTNINRTIVVNNNVTNVYRFNRPETVTAVPRDAFQRGRPTGGLYQRIAQADLDRGRVVDRPDARHDPRNAWNDRNGDGRPDNRPDGRNDDSVAEQIRRRQQEALRGDSRERDNMTWEQRQQLQNRRDQERNAIAEQQQRTLQDGARRQQQEQEERVRRQQVEQQQRVAQQQREQQERVQRQQQEQQQRAQQQQMGMQERIQRQQAEQAEQQRRAQQQRAQQQMQQQREAQQRDNQQREFQQRAQRQQMEQQERAQQQQRQMQEQRQSQERQRQQQAENEARGRGQFNGQQGGPPQKPMRPGMRPGDNDRS